MSESANRVRRAGSGRYRRLGVFLAGLRGEFDEVFAVKLIGCSGREVLVVVAPTTIANVAELEIDTEFAAAMESDEDEPRPPVTLAGLKAAFPDMYGESNGRGKAKRRR